MRSVLLRADPAAHETIVTALWELGTVGIIEEPSGLRAFFKDEAQVSGALDVFGKRILEVRIETPLDPADFPKLHCDPLPVGARFWIAPSWVDSPVPAGRLRLAIDTPNAFGTGRHETTQLALEQLEQHVTGAATVLDIGSGSGILSEAALLLGARRVFTCDIHPDAISSTKPLLRPGLFLGSADAIRSGAADVVAANISTKVIDALWWELNRITKPEGLLILTGFNRERPPMCFTPVQVTERGDWLCWLCRPRPIAPGEKQPMLQAHSLEWW